MREISKQTEFFTLYKYLIGWSNTKDKKSVWYIDGKIKELCQKVPIDTLSFYHGRHRHWPDSVGFYATFKNGSTLTCSTGGQVSLSINNGHFIVTQNLITNRVIEFMNKKFNVTGRNQKAVSSFLRGKKSWNYVILKSFRD